MIIKDVKMLLREKIAEKRTNAGLTQEALAEKVGVSRNTVYNWEAGISKPNVKTIKRLAEVLGVSADFFYGEYVFDDEPTKNRDELAVAAEGAEKGKFPRGLFIALAIINGILLPIAGFFTYVIGGMSIVTNTGDVVVSNRNVDIHTFYLMIAISAIMLIAEVTFIVLLIKNRKQKK